MNRRASTLALALGGALTWLGLDAPAAAGSCLPAAVLSGDPEVAASVASALATLGVVGGEADGACEPVAVTVRRDDGGIAVTVGVAHDRVEDRLVADARTAAAWIESWASDDAEPLWQAVVVPPAATAATTASSILATDVQPPSVSIRDEVARARRGDHDGSRWLPSVLVQVGRDLASDGSAWDGVGGAACVRLGRLCIGAAARHVTNGGFRRGDEQTAFDRTATGVLATAALRLQIARAALAPELTAGLGWTSTRRNGSGAGSRSSTA